MNQESENVYSIEKIISVISYFTMGIAGLIWLFLAHILKRKTRFFLLYNIAQSMTIAIILVLFKVFMGIILFLISKIPFLDFLAAIINLILSFKIISVPSWGVSFTIIELLLCILLFYITIGVILGRIFYIPYLTDFIRNVMKSRD